MEEAARSYRYGDHEEEEGWHGEHVESKEAITLIVRGANSTMKASTATNAADCMSSMPSVNGISRAGAEVGRAAPLREQLDQGEAEHKAPKVGEICDAAL